MWYVFDEHRNLADKDSSIVTGIYKQGETCTFDGIEVYCLLGSADTDHPLFVDKNHDLSYYFAGDDFLNTSESMDAINSTAKYGYEWGGQDIKTGVTATTVGSGLSNTNSLIELNLQPFTPDWHVVWDKVNEFRQSHSNNWFVPSLDELDLIYENRANLSNISTVLSGYPYYWSSSEASSHYAWYQYFGSGGQNSFTKAGANSRVRLCYTI